MGLILFLGYGFFIPHRLLRCVQMRCNLPPFLYTGGHDKGSPFSPLLFNLAREPLAIWLHNLEAFEGISHLGLMHKLSLNVDNILLFVLNPLYSIPLILEILDHFGHLSGYEINLQKSELFPLNPAAKELSFYQFPFKLSLESFKYFRVFFTSSYA